MSPSSAQAPPRVSFSTPRWTNFTRPNLCATTKARAMPAVAATAVAATGMAPLAWAPASSTATPSRVKTSCPPISAVTSTRLAATSGFSSIFSSRASSRTLTMSPPTCATGSSVFTDSRIQRISHMRPTCRWQSIRAPNPNPDRIACGQCSAITSRMPQPATSSAARMRDRSWVASSITTTPRPTSASRIAGLLMRRFCGVGWGSLNSPVPSPRT